MLQGWWTDEFGPDAIGSYANKSYWLCTENWSGQNYPIDLDVYYDTGGFSNGYVPLFFVVGFQNKVYWDGNSSDFRNALRLAIDEMVAEGVYTDKPVEDKILMLEESLNFDVSNIFVDIDGNPVTVTLENNSDPSIISAELIGNTLTITANSTTPGTSTVTIKGTAGGFSDTDEFVITVFDPASYNVEDFETGDFSKYQWEFSGSSDWFINTTYSYEGTYCTQSSDISSNQSAEISIDMDYAVAGNLFFWYRVSSEGNYDFLKFYIDGVEKIRISGSSAWIEASFPISAGSHQFKWRYDKDVSGDEGMDCAWIDEIIFEGGTPTGICNEITPSSVDLYQNYPNPFNPNTQIKFSLDKVDHVKLSVLNYSGQLVSSLVDRVMGKGIHEINFDASDLNSGIYFYILETDESSISKKMILIK
ncbi:MAG: T9SS type A sorting domain-containing protein [Candidatus Delongbacteria bacterium]|nr:T9SS type A sorting domain-containing protein [Candidatus Delongbacteria bacterium]